MTHRILEAVAELPKVMECFSLPVQAGSDAVLESMRRGYTLDEYLRKDRRGARRSCPTPAITTDIIVGYPGETDADFEATCELLEELASTRCTSRRTRRAPARSPSARMDDDVPAAVKAARLHRVEEHRGAASRSEINRPTWAPRRRSWSKACATSSRSAARARGKLVHLDAPARVGSLVDVRIEHAGPFSLRGAPS